MSLLLDALDGKNFNRLPIWFMRQAGRYLPRYQALKEKFSLEAMFAHPELIVETTLLPFEVMELDAAILFADIMTVVEGWGLQWHVEEGVGPLVLHPPEDYSTLSLQPGGFAHVVQAIRELKKLLYVPLLGFAGGPFTVASFLLEGKVSKDLAKVKRVLYQNPEKMHALLEKLTEVTIHYLHLQIAAGVDAVQIFDSLAHHLSAAAFNEFALPYLCKIREAITVPVILFCRGTAAVLPQLIELRPTAISFDWQTPMHGLPASIAYQGNLDPQILFGTRAHIKKEVETLLQGLPNPSRYIFNLGHGILPGTPLSNVQFLVDTVRAYNAAPTFA